MRTVVLASGLFLLASAGLAAAGPAALDKPAFTATPAELLAAAQAAPAADAPIHVLRDEITISYDDRGRAERRYRVVALIVKPAGADDWGTIGLGWSPFYQDKPTVRARVIAASGRVDVIDPSLINDAPVVSESPSVFSDRRTLEAPLPRLAVGAVLEEEFVIKDREPLLAAGETELVPVLRSVPILRATVTISAPTARTLHVLARGFAKAPTPRKATRDGRTIWTYELGALAAREHHEVGVPGDVAATAYIGISTAPSWAAVAADYQRLVEARLKDTIALPDGVQGKTPRETVDRAVAWLHAHVRYTGIELRDSAIIPFSPKDTAARGFGDCKDKATLLVALLRAAGVHADLAVLSEGPGTDVDRGLPGMGSFDHAIVRAQLGGKDLWIDATEDMLAAGQLPARDQGRLALVLGAGTKDLTATPIGAPADNLIREVRTYKLAELDYGTITERSQEHGVFSDTLRRWIRDHKRADIEKDLTPYVERVYKGKLAGYRADPVTDPTQPFELSVDVDRSLRAFSARTQIDVYLFPSDTFSRLPSTLTSTESGADDELKDRTIDYAWFMPHVYEIESRLALPPGYSAPRLIEHEQQALGTMTLDIARRLDHGELVITYRLDTGKRRITAAELRATRAAVLRAAQTPAEHVILAQIGQTLMQQGKLVEAIAEYRRLIALHPKEALHYGQLADAYRSAGMIAAARRTALQGTTVEPTSGDAFTVLGFQLIHDSTGRQYGFDADRKAAIDAYRKALVLTPEHLGAMQDLATTLARDDRGEATTDPRDYQDAIAMWERAKETSKGDDFDQDLALAYLRGGKPAEAEALARTLPEGETSTAIDATAIAAGGRARDAMALIESRASGDAQSRVIDDVMQRLTWLRRYDAMRALQAEIPGLATDASQQAMLRRLRPIDVGALGAADPVRPIYLALGSMSGFAADHPPWDADVAAEIDVSAREMASMRSFETWRHLPRAVAIDLLAANTELTVGPRSADGWRVELRARDSTADYYVVLDHGRARLIGGTEMAAGTARHVLELAAHKDLAGAARWLKQLSDDAGRTLKPGSLPELEEHALKRYREAKAPSKDLIEVVAAVLTARRNPTVAAPILRRCPVSDEDTRKLCRAALLDVVFDLEQWGEAAELATKVEGPGLYPTIVRGVALAHLGRGAEATQVLDDAIAKSPDHLGLLGVRARLAIGLGTWADAQPFIDKLIARPGADVNDFAWTHLYYDATPERARAIAERGRGTDESPELANTMAAIEAESDHPGAAWKLVQESIAGHADRRPSNGDWYVIGRIAETYGLRDDAIAAYRRVAKPSHTDFVPSSYDFAQRNLKRMGVK
jgi:tetratricopeptide (TPR) repeat protein